MISLNVNLNGDGAAEDLIARGLKAIHLGNDAPAISVAYLSGGMGSGKPSVAFIFELPGGKEFVVAEMSAVLFCAAARMVKTKACMEGIELEGIV